MPGFPMNVEKIMEEKREACRRALPLRDQRLGNAPRAEEPLAQARLGRDHLAGEALVVSERADELQNERDILRRRGTNPRARIHRLAHG